MTKRNRKKMIAILLCMLLLVGCSNNKGAMNGTAASENNKTESNTTESDNTKNGNTDIGEAESDTSSSTDAITTSYDVEFDSNDYYSNEIPSDAVKIVLNNTSAEIEGSGAKANGKVITISSAGVYVLKGTLSDGQIVVDAGDQDDVQLILNGITISCSDSSPIFIKNANKVVLSLPDGTVNTLSDTANYVLADAKVDEPNATIYSKSDLLINGTGSFVINANYNNGVNSKDDLTIIQSTLQITSVDDAIIGRDMLAAKDATVTVKADGDGLKSTNSEDSPKGFIVIKGGTYNITSRADSVQAYTTLLISDATMSLASGGGSANGPAHADNNKPGMWGKPDMNADATSSATITEDNADALDTEDKADTIDVADTKDTQTTKDSTSGAKGMKAGSVITITGGTFTIDSSNDALHSNNNITITGGTIDISAGDDGIHADTKLNIENGIITIKKSYEGIESSLINIEDGKIYVTASDDGINVSGGTETSSTTGTNGQNSFETASNGSLQVHGGYLYVNSEGDGLDSNGSINITGGTIVVSGPTNDGNGPLDYQGTFEMSGGYLVAAGSSGMIQAPSDTSSQSSIGVLFTQAQAAGTLIHIEDSNGKDLVTFAPAKTFAALVVCSPDIKKGEAYTVYTGGSSTGNEVNGIYSDGTYKAGSKMVEFTISDVVTWVNESGITTQPAGFGGGMGSGKRGFRGGNPPAGMTPPTNKDMPAGGALPPDGNVQGDNNTDSDGQ